MEKFIKTKKSLSELEGWSWNTEIPSEDNSSYEEYNFYLLHKKPLNEYSDSDIYFMIGQESGLKYFMSQAVNLLLPNLIVQIEDYPGDLLCRVLRIEEIWSFFSSDLRSEFQKRLIELKSELKYVDLDYEIKSELASLISERIR